MNNIFFLQKKTISLLTDIKGEKMFLAYAQIFANISTSDSNFCMNQLAEEI